MSEAFVQVVDGYGRVVSYEEGDDLTVKVGPGVTVEVIDE